MRIGILTDGDNRVAAFEEGGTVKIYDKDAEEWKTVDSYEYSTDGLVSTRLFHERLKELCEWMGSCKVLGARRFRGTYRAVFEKYNISMCELSESNHLSAEQLLDSPHRIS